MYDIDELERKWIKYKRRKVAIYLSVSILSISVIGGTLYIIAYFNNKKDIKEQIAQESSIKHTNIKRDRDIIITKGKTETHLDTTTIYNNRHLSTTQQTIEEPKVLTNSSKEHKQPKKINLIIKDPRNENIVKEIENRFNQSKNYNDAIYLAEYYYSKQNYKKAEYWAMQANIINSLPEESWLIFAKSKVKSGHRVEALKVLQAYYDKTGSTRVLDLIDIIRKNGQF